MARRLDHEELVDRGSALHDARKYAAALPWFDRALRLVPDCPAAVYNRANTLHMLGRDDEARMLLLDLIGTDLGELRRRCPTEEVSGLQTDAYMLLFWVAVESRGYCDEAFAYAEEHLRRRRRGVPSVWSVRQVRKDIATARREWDQSRAAQAE